MVAPQSRQLSLPFSMKCVFFSTKCSPFACNKAVRKYLNMHLLKSWFMYALELMNKWNRFSLYNSQSVSIVQISRNSGVGKSNTGVRVTVVFRSFLVIQFSFKCTLVSFPGRAGFCETEPLQLSAGK